MTKSIRICRKRCTAFRCGYGAEKPAGDRRGSEKYIDTHILGYTGPTEEYFDAVCGWMKRRNDWNIKKEEIVSTHGVVTVLAVSVLAYTDPGDGVITMPPVYYPFRMTIEHNTEKRGVPAHQHERDIHD